MSDLLRRVYHVFDPAPLGPGDSDLYIDLEEVRGEGHVVTRLANAIRLSAAPTCQILAGHHGSGKSTELRNLQRVLEEGDDRSFVVVCESIEDIDPNDMDFQEVLIAIVRQMAGQLEKRFGVSLKPGYFSDRFGRLKALLGAEVAFDKLELSAGLLNLSAAIKSSPDTRAKVREILEPDTGNLLYAANDVIGQAKQALLKKGFRKLVILVDDLDKMVLRPHPTSGCSTGVHLFINRKAQLAAFECHVLYTMPLGLAYSTQGQTIASLYGGQVPVIPMTKVRQRPPSSEPHGAGVQKFRDVITARLEKAGITEDRVFESNEVRDEVIKLSGGQPRELMILTREAMVSGELPIGSDAVRRAARESRRAYERQLRRDHWAIIEQARDNGSITRTRENDDLVRELLDSRTILQYVNEQEWYAENPIIADLEAPALT